MITFLVNFVVRSLLIGCLGMGLMNKIYAHPHMFVDVSPKIIKVAQDQVVVAVEWLFDPYTTDGFLIDYDENGNQKLDKKELAAISKLMFKNIKRFGYFTNFLINGKKQTITPKNFSITLKEVKTKKMVEKQLLCKFEIQQKLSTSSGSKLSFDLSFYDETVYSVLYPKGKMEFAKGIKTTSNELKKSKCRYLFAVTL